MGVSSSGRVQSIIIVLNNGEKYLITGDYIKSVVIEGVIDEMSNEVVRGTINFEAPVMVFYYPQSEDSLDEIEQRKFYLTDEDQENKAYT